MDLHSYLPDLWRSVFSFEDLPSAEALRGSQPGPEKVFRALHTKNPRVVILGQDPYPTAGVPTGLAFESLEEKRPASLRNIFVEYETDLGFPKPSSGDLESWSKNGVLLLNAALTVKPGQPGSHRKLWAPITAKIIREITRRDPDLVFVLWGGDARKLAFENGAEHHLFSSHPSPLSAHRTANPFFGSRPFSRANEMLESLGREPVSWKLK